MSDVDNKVVSLTFDSSNFEKGVSVTLEGLQRLEQGLEFDTAKSGLADLEGAVNGVDFSRMEGAIESIDNKFSALGAVAFTAIQEVSHSAIDVAKDMFDKTLGQVLTGGSSRALAIEQAKFQFEGLGINVEAAMTSALDAVRGTAYGLDEAAALAAQFGAGGTQAGAEMTTALRAVAGSTAIVGGNFKDIGSIFADVAAKGELTGAHLFSFTSRNLGMAEALAKQWGTTAEAVEEAASRGEISFEEFAAGADAAFGEHATRANETYTGSLANLNAALSRVGAEFLAPKYEAQRNLFNTLAPAIDKVKDSLGPLVDAWKLFVDVQAIKGMNLINSLDFEGFDKIVPDIVRIFKNIYTAIGSFIKPIKRAFRQAFDFGGFESLEKIALAVKRFTRGLELSTETAGKVKRIFSGLFAIFSIGWAIIEGVAGVIMDIVRALLPAGDGLLSFGAGVGDTLVALKKFLVDGKGIGVFFEEISDKAVDFFNAIKNSDAVKAFGDALAWVGNAIADLFGGGADVGGAGLGRLSQRFDHVVDSGKGFVETMKAIFDALKDIVMGVGEWLGETFDGLGGAIADSIETGDFDRVLDVINIGLLGGIVALLRKFLQDGVSLDLTGGLMENLKEGFEALTGVMEEMQTALKAHTLMTIAKAIGILTISLVALSLIDSGKLTKAIAAVASGLGALVGSMALLAKIDIAESAKIVALGVAMLLLAGAMLLLAIPIALLSTIGLFDLAKGLGATMAGLAGLAAAAKTIGKAGPDMMAGGFSMLVMAGALLLLSVSVWAFSTLDWDELARGFTGIAGGLVGLTLAIRNMPDTSKAGLSLFLISLSLSAIAKAVKKMAELSWDEMSKGIIGLGTALGGMVLIANSMQGSVGGAGAILLMSVALIAMAYAVGQFSDMSWGELIKGLLGMAAAMVIVGGLGFIMGILAPELALAGLALIPLAFGLNLLADAVKTFGNLSWAELGMGLLALAASMIVIALASVLLFPAVVPMLAFGAALTLLGIGMLSFGAGISLFASGMATLAETGAGGAEAMVDILRTIAGAIPAILQGFAEGFLAFMQVIVDAAPELVEGIITILSTLLEGITTLAPQISEALIAVMTMLVEMFVAQAPMLIEAGISIVTALIQGLTSAMPTIVPAVANLITAFLNGLANSIGRIVTAGINLITAFLNGIANGYGRIVTAAIQIVTSVLNGIANQIGSIVAAGTNIIVSFINGISNSLGRIVTAATQLITRFLEGIRNSANQITTAAIELVIGLIEDLTTAINENSGRLGEAAGELGRAVIAGIRDAIVAGAGSLVGAVTDAVGGLVGGAMDRLGLGGPSRVFIDFGERIIEGLVVGLDRHSSAVESAETLGDDVVNTMRSISQRMTDELAGMDEMNPTISPVLDLDQVRRDAGGLNSILASNALAANSSYAQAQRISSDAIAREQELVTSGGVKEIKFEQTINAPRELSAGEIYKNTRSQIAMAKTDLEDIE